MSLTQDKSLIAVARENRAIEIWKTNSFTQLVSIPGHKNVDIRNVHWLEHEAVLKSNRNEETNILYYPRVKNGKALTEKRRLITSGLNGMVIEWDLQTVKPIAKLNCHCAIWSSVMVGKYMYIGCEDGSIRVLKIKKSKIELVKMLVKSSASCLSLAPVIAAPKVQAEKIVKEGSSSDDEMETEANYGPVNHLFAGYADGTIKMWEISTGNCQLHIEKQTQKEKAKDGACMIWQIVLFKNYLISGDSKGELCVWDSKFGTMIKQFSQL